MMANIEKGCFLALLALVFLLPIPLASHRVLPWSVFEFWIALQTLFLLFSLRGHFPWHRLSRFKWILVPLSVFQLWVLLQIIPLPSGIVTILSPTAHHVYTSLSIDTMTLSLDKYATFTGLLKGIGYTLFAFNAALLINSIKRVKYVLYTLIISGTFQGFYAALMVLLGTKSSLVFAMPEVEIATGSFVYKNHLANYLIMTLSVGIGVIVSQLSAVQSDSWNTTFRRVFTSIISTKMVVRLCLIIMVIALVMTHSRMGNFTFFVVTAIGGITALIFYKNPPRALNVLIVSLLVVDVLIVGTLFGLDKVQDRIKNFSYSSETRDQVVEWSMDIIRDYPLTGTGLGSFYSTFPSYTKFNIGYYDYAHNEYIQFLVEAGIPMTVMLGLMVLFALRLAFRAIRISASRTLKGTGLGCLMAIIGMLIHCTVDFNLQPPANAVTFILILILAGCTMTIPAARTKIAR